MKERDLFFSCFMKSRNRSSGSKMLSKSQFPSVWLFCLLLICGFYSHGFTVAVVHPAPYASCILHCRQEGGSVKNVGLSLEGRKNEKTSVTLSVVCVPGHPHASELSSLVGRNGESAKHPFLTHTVP